MLEELRIKNFQCHVEYRANLNQPITVITGPTDAGKSALLRAIRWVCLNRPSGAAYIRAGTSNTHVGLQVDGRRVVRRRGGANYYRLDGARYDAVGTNVPPDIADLLRVDDLNFQGQHDPAFWFALTPGQVSRELNRIINLDEIDRVLSALHAIRRKAAATEEVAVERLKVARTETERLAFVPEYLRDLAALQVLEDTAARTAAARDKLIRWGDEAAQAHKTALRAAAATEDADKLTALRDAAAAARGRTDGLAQLLADVDQIRQRRDTLLESATTTENEMRRVAGGRCPICGNKLRKESDGQGT